MMIILDIILIVTIVWIVGIQIYHDLRKDS